MTNATKNKILIVVGILVLAALFFGGYQCGKSSVTKKEGTVKIITEDSLIYRDTGRIVPYKVETFVKGKDGETVYDTLWGDPEVIIQPTDTAAILERFYETAYYTHQFDTGRWKITVEESITENRIKDWSLKAVSSDTVTTNTVVLKPPQRLILFFGVSALGNFNDPFHMAGADLTLKTPTDRQYTIGANIDRHGTLFGEVGVKFPIRLRKRQ